MLENPPFSLMISQLQTTIYRGFPSQPCLITEGKGMPDVLLLFLNVFTLVNVDECS
jgi:hypothetical protein